MRRPCLPGAVFFRPAFARAGYAALFAALTATHRFLLASEIAFRAAALIFRFFLGFTDSACGASELFLIPAHLAFWAAAILRRDAALNLRLRFPVSGIVTADCVRPPFNMLRRSAI